MRISVPSEGEVGGTPTPRKDSVASVMIAVATWIVASTSTGPITLGSTWRSMMRQRRHAGHARRLHVFLVALDHASSRAPCARTAPSRSARWRRSARRRRASRARSGTARRPTPAISSAIRIGGKDSITSQTRIRKASTQPPPEAGEQAQTDADQRPTAPPRRGPRPARCARRRSAAERMSRPWSSVPSRYLARALGLIQAGGRRASSELERGQVEGIVRRHPAGEHRAEEAQERDDGGDHARPARCGSCDRHRCRASALGFFHREQQRAASPARAASEAKPARERRGTVLPGRWRCPLEGSPSDTQCVGAGVVT